MHIPVVVGRAFPTLSEAISSMGRSVMEPIKAKVELDRNLAHIYVILHCNHFSILSKGTDCEITTRDKGFSNLVSLK